MIGVVADDFTGAAEIGAVGLRHGLRSEVVVDGLPSGHADLVCLDTDSRSCTAEEAGRRAVDAAKLLAASGVDWIYKKTDSVLRGQVVAELTAMQGQLQQTRALLVPANPSLGRVIRDGHYFIHGKPICETEFVHDPEYPRRSSKVLDLLGRGPGIPVHVCQAGGMLPVSGIVLGEVATPADLAVWASLRGMQALMAGGAEFFGALLAASGLTVKHPGGEPPDEALPKGSKLFVCGTASEAGRAFISLARQGGVPVFSLPEKLAVGSDRLEQAGLDALVRNVVEVLGASGWALLCVGLPPVTDRTIARGLALQLVALATRVLQQTNVSHVFAEGGATAVELVRRMGWRRLGVQREVCPGVVMLSVASGRSLTVKPGSYIWPRGFLEAIWPG